MRQTKKKLGEMLIEAGVIDELKLNAALGQQKQWGGKLASVLIDMGFVDEKAVVSVLEQQLGTKCVALEGLDIPQKVLNTVKVDVAKKYTIMPIELDKNGLSIAMGDPTDVRTLDELSFSLGIRIKPVLALESEIKNAIARHYEGIDSGSGKTYRVSVEQMSETMSTARTSQVEPVIERDFYVKPVEQTETPSNTVIEALISVLIEKGVMTREDLLKKLSEKSKKQP